MPSTQDAGAPAPLSPFQTAPDEATPSPALALARANGALWLATLSLMTAYLQNTAPAHRLLLARRIASNLATLSRQDCFAAGCRATFARLARCWQQRAERLSPAGEAPRRGWWTRLFQA